MHDVNRTQSTRRSLAVVTGASSGIGGAFSRLLAASGRDLIVAARRAHRLDVLRDELEGKHGVRVVAVPCDLATTSGCDALLTAIAAHPGCLDRLVLAAGSAGWGAFAGLSAEAEEARVALGTTSLVRIMGGTWNRLSLEPGAGLIVVSSLASFQATPYMTTYAATKAFQRFVAEGLAAEANRGQGATVVTVCPGPVDTEFVMVAGTQRLVDRVPVLSAERVARESLRRLHSGGKQPTFVPGWRNKVSFLIVKLLPSRMTLAASERIHRRDT